MKNQEIKANKKNNGITLIALVITIIVLLILAGVTIATLTGENGILTNARKASEQTEIGDEQEKVKLSAIGAIAENNGEEITRRNLNNELTSYIGTEEIDYTLSESETAPFVVTYTNSGRSYLIDEKGNVSEYIDISKYVNVGNYVDYNPTVSDKNGTPVEPNKLTYASPEGNGMKHGNGYFFTEEGGQKFTATVSTKWRILDIGKGTVTLISAEPIKKDDPSKTGESFILAGPVGYLYAEQELNEICKIYGYGYGANTSQVTEYSYGGPEDGILTGKITGSGARSITIEDINKQAGITEEDYVTLDMNYGNTANSTIHYPTITTTSGKSDSAEEKNLKYTNYSYPSSKIKNPVIQNMLFNGNYWLASRSIKSFSSTSLFCVRYVNSYLTDANDLCDGNSPYVGEGVFTSYAIRPVVTLKSNVIDINTNYNTEGHWNLK